MRKANLLSNSDSMSDICAVRQTLGLLRWRWFDLEELHQGTGFKGRRIIEALQALIERGELEMAVRNVGGGYCIPVYRLATAQESTNGCAESR